MLLARGVHAFCDVPAFSQSAMDGYAFAFDSWNDRPLRVVAVAPAARQAPLSVAAGEAARIFTGAPVPQGADTVVMQEKTELKDGAVHILDEAVRRGLNVRDAGSEIKTGEAALPAGSVLTPAAVGFLAGIGIDRVEVIPEPPISIIVTGKELVQPNGAGLSHGQVYESNSFALRAALQRAGLRAPSVRHVDDDVAELTAALADALARGGLVLLTGGVSEGDYDFVLRAAEACGVQTIFHKVKQRPGKPLFFGVRKAEDAATGSAAGKNKDAPAAVVFGLPGNPSSVLTCFYQHVLPALSRMTGRPLQLARARAPLANSYAKTHQLTHFLKGYYDGTAAQILDAQESYRMKSFARANCLIELGEAAREYPRGEAVDVHLL